MRRWVASLRGAHRSHRRPVAPVAPADREAREAGPTFLWAAYYYDEVKAERERRTSLEQRGLGIISLAGVLIALLLNASRDLRGAEWSTLAAALLLGALGALVTAALFGLLCAMPRFYGGLDPARLLEILQEHWGAPDDIASRQIGAVHFRTIEISLSANLAKVRFLWIAIGAIAVGIVLSSTVLIAVIFGSAA